MDYEDNMPQPYEEDTIAISLGVAVTVFTFAVCCCFAGLAYRCRYSNGRTSFPVSTTSHFLVATTLFLVYAIHFYDYDGQDYYGAMRTTGYDIEYIHSTLGGSRYSGPTYQRYFQVGVQVEFGHSWACGEVNKVDDRDQYCHSVIQQRRRFTACTTRSNCTEKELGSAKEQAVQYARLLYNDTEESYIPFDPYVGPSQDENWPTMVLYGDCSRCDVTAEDPNMHTMDVVFGFGVVFLFLSPLWFCVESCMECFARSYKEGVKRREGGRFEV